MVPVAFAFAFAFAFGLYSEGQTYQRLPEKMQAAKRRLERAKHVYDRMIAKCADRTGYRIEYR